MLNDADLVLPDGAPVAWTMRMLGFGGQERVSGPDFMWDYCAVAQEQNTSIFLYGNRTATLDKLMSVMRESFPGLCVAGAHSPPFRQLSDEEDEAVIKMLNASGAGVIFVSLGCPKQELWMASRRNRINAVMFGLGAAFDYHAGSVRRAPPWMRKAGFEWLHRLTHEPRRLWKRYLIANSIFLWRAAADVSHHFSKRGRRCAFGMPPDSQGRQTYESGTVAGSQVDGLTTRETQ
jgi:N-acetylglucosaminyldiphosphoundecaprenol N-acetyl-beta-D-mannosaminyltransferase